MKKKNTKPTVVTKPSGKQGGTNAPAKAVTKATGKTGGVNTPPKGAMPAAKYGASMMKKGGATKAKKK